MWWARTVWATALLLQGTLQGCLWISGAEHVRRTDQDGDGVATPEDCDDANPNQFPGNAEVPCDGLDNDCNVNTADSPASVQTPISATEVKSVSYDSISRALEGARSGDTVLVCPGRWRERLVITIPSLTISGSSTPEATVFDADGLGGPAIEVLAPDVTIRSLTVENGIGRNREGALGTWGGGVYAWDAPGRVTLNRVIVANNVADVGAGVVGPKLDELVVLDSTLRANTATTSGGGLYVSSSGSLTNTLVTQNTAADSGGGIALAPGAALALLGTSEVRLNVARTGGGVLVDSGATLTGGWIVENTAEQAGGGVDSRSGDLTDVKIEANTAEVEGGGLRIFGAIVTRGELLDNHAPQGGGLFASGNVDIRGANFERNVALAGDGGAILAVEGLLSVAADGAGTESVPTSFGENGAVHYGGAIAAVGASLDLTGGQITACVAESGGGIAIVDTGACPACTYTVNGLRLYGNGATRDGGGIWTNRSLALGNVALDGNGTYGAGGGLHASGTAVVTIVGATGTGNLADNGGVAAFYTGGALEPSTVVASTFTGNEADDGAVLFIASGFVEASASLFDNNDAGRGAAVTIEEDGHFHSIAVTYRDNLEHDIEVLDHECSVEADNLDFECDEGAGNGSCSPAGACP